MYWKAAAIIVQQTRDYWYQTNGTRLRTSGKYKSSNWYSGIVDKGEMGLSLVKLSITLLLPDKYFCVSFSYNLSVHIQLIAQ